MATVHCKWCGALLSALKGVCPNCAAPIPNSPSAFYPKDLISSIVEGRIDVTVKPPDELL